MKRYGNYIFLGCCVLGFALYGLFGGSTKTVFDFGDDTLAVCYGDFEASIPYSEMQTVELVEEIDFGTMLDGGINKKYRWGDWENDTWGAYTQCTSTLTDYCIVLTMNNETIYVLSYQDEKTTVELSKMIPGYLTAHGYSVQVIQSTDP